MNTGSSSSNKTSKLLTNMFLTNHTAFSTTSAFMTDLVTKFTGMSPTNTNPVKWFDPTTNDISMGFHRDLMSVCLYQQPYFAGQSMVESIYLPPSSSPHWADSAGNPKLTLSLPGIVPVNEPNFPRYRQRTFGPHHSNNPPPGEMWYGVSPYVSHNIDGVAWSWDEFKAGVVDMNYIRTGANHHGVVYQPGLVKGFTIILEFGADGCWYIRPLAYQYFDATLSNSYSDPTTEDMFGPHVSGTSGITEYQQNPGPEMAVSVGVGSHHCVPFRAVDSFRDYWSSRTYGMIEDRVDSTKSWTFTGKIKRFQGANLTDASFAAGKAGYTGNEYWYHASPRLEILGGHESGTDPDNLKFEDVTISTPERNVVCLSYISSPRTSLLPAAIISKDAPGVIMTQIAPSVAVANQELIVNTLGESPDINKFAAGTITWPGTLGTSSFRTKSIVNSLGDVSLEIAENTGLVRNYKLRFGTSVEMETGVGSDNLKGVIGANCTVLAGALNTFGDAQWTLS